MSSKTCARMNQQVVPIRWRSLIPRPQTIAAILQTSVLAPHLEPRITSGDRYCLVWMSFVKWWLTQHALPRSAILTLMTSKPRPLSSAFRFSPVDDVDEFEDLSREIPETSFVRRSLAPKELLAGRATRAGGHGPDARCVQVSRMGRTYAVFSRCFCFSSSLGEESLALFPAMALRQ